MRGRALSLAASQFFSLARTTVPSLELAAAADSRALLPLLLPPLPAASGARTSSKSNSEMEAATDSLITADRLAAAPAKNARAPRTAAAAAGRPSVAEAAATDAIGAAAAEGSSSTSICGDGFGFGFGLGAWGVQRKRGVVVAERGGACSARRAQQTDRADRQSRPAAHLARDALALLAGVVGLAPRGGVADGADTRVLRLGGKRPRAGGCWQPRRLHSWLPSEVGRTQICAVVVLDAQICVRRQIIHGHGLADRGARQRGGGQEDEGEEGEQAGAGAAPAAAAAAAGHCGCLAAVSPITGDSAAL
jgi:hypothetical protein